MIETEITFHNMLANNADKIFSYSWFHLLSLEDSSFVLCVPENKNQYQLGDIPLVDAGNLDVVCE